MSVDLDVKKLKVHANLYCALQKRSESKGGDILALGYLVPDGIDSAAQKRKATADSWAKGYRYNKETSVKPITFKNEPMVGFRLLGGCRTASQGGGETAFRIEDPRGFETEIRASNVSYLIQNGMIRNGEILVECIWARDGANNRLIPVESEAFNAAAKIDETKPATKVDIKSLKAGDKVKLHNDIVGVYLGKFFSYDSSYEQGYGRRDSQTQPVKLIAPISDKAKHFFLCDEVHTTYSGKSNKVQIIRLIGSPKIVEIVESAEKEIMVQEAERLINEFNYDGEIRTFGEGRFGEAGYGKPFSFVSAQRIKSVKITKKYIPQNENALVRDTYRRPYFLFCEYNGETYMNPTMHNGTDDISLHITAKLDLENTRMIVNEFTRNTNYSYSYYKSNAASAIECTINDVNLFMLVADFITPAGTHFTDIPLK